MTNKKTKTKTRMFTHKKTKTKTRMFTHKKTKTLEVVDKKYIYLDISNVLMSVTHKACVVTEITGRQENIQIVRQSCVKVLKQG